MDAKHSKNWIVRSLRRFHRPITMPVPTMDHARSLWQIPTHSTHWCRVVSFGKPQTFLFPWPNHYPTLTDSFIDMQSLWGKNCNCCAMTRFMIIGQYSGRKCSSNATAITTRRRHSCTGSRPRGRQGKALSITSKPPRCVHCDASTSNHLANRYHLIFVFYQMHFWQKDCPAADVSLVSSTSWQVARNPCPSHSPIDIGVMTNASWWIWNASERLTNTIGWFCLYPGDCDGRMALRNAHETWYTVVAALEQQQHQPK